MKLLSCAICGPGRIRSENQDNFYLNGTYRQNPADMQIQRAQRHDSAAALYAVADGMGGEKYGEVASLMAVRAMDALRRSGRGQDLTHYLLERNAEICDFIRQNHGVRSGSTFVGLCICGASAALVNIGDSRGYLFRDGSLSQLSRDHTAVWQMIRLGAITPEKARVHPDRHKLTQHLGIFPDEMVIEPYEAAGTVRDGDLFLLCSDGITDMLEDKDISRLLCADESPEAAAEGLFSAATAAGGRDNITVLLVRAEKDETR